jgi:conjugal transfer pilus assembly protein TraB
MFANFKSSIPGLKSAYVRQIVAVAGLALAAWGGMYVLLSGGPEKISGKHTPDEVSSKDGTTTNLAAPGDQVDTRERWIGNAGKTVADHETRLTEQERLTKDILTRFLALEKNAAKPVAASATPSAAASQASAPTDAENVASSNKGATAGPTQKGAAPQQYPAGTPADAQSRMPPGPQFGKTARVALPSDLNRNGLGAPVGANGRTGYGENNAFPPPAPSGIGVVKISVADKVGLPGAAHTGVQPKIKQEGSSFLPIGFVPVRLLGGIDAPTGGQAQSNPLPVLMEVIDMANLPNRFRANVKQCMVVGAAVGDLSSERSYIRAELLSCIRRDGRVLEAKAHGSIFGEDGKLGMRGRLVTKQGQLLANSLLAGVVGGIGQGVATYTAQTATTVTNGSSTVNITPGKYAEAGVGGGVGQALNRLANYYISLAEKTFPVIEIDAQRRGDLAFTKGIELDTPLPELVDLPSRAHGRRPLNEESDE